MINDLKYQVRSREIVDLVSAMRNSRLTLSPYFQRNLVWRDAHKREFIDTILKGYPFPQIFLARGSIDLETMQAFQCVVDGQQRLNTIREFVDGKLEVSGKYFTDLTPREKEDFLKYEVAVIDFDLSADDERMKDIFHRLNRTYYSLSAIERLCSEYSASEFLLVARVLCGEIVNEQTSAQDESLDEVDIEGSSGQVGNTFLRDPGVSDTTWEWLTAHSGGNYNRIITKNDIFSKYEFDRKVPLMFTLNVMCTYLAGYFNRNDKVRKFLYDKNDEFQEKDEVIDSLNEVSQFIDDLALPADSMWWNKANFFTLVCELSGDQSLMKIGTNIVKDRIVAFSKNVPSDYALAAREGVGRKSQREFRGKMARLAILGEGPL